MLAILRYLNLKKPVNAQYFRAAPMIGFLGTVTRNDHCFLQDGQWTKCNPDVLAGGIYQALITTAFGFVLVSLLCRIQPPCSKSGAGDFPNGKVNSWIHGSSSGTIEISWNSVMLSKTEVKFRQNLIFRHDGYYFPIADFLYAHFQDGSDQHAIAGIGF